MSPLVIALVFVDVFAPTSGGVGPGVGVGADSGSGVGAGAPANDPERPAPLIEPTRAVAAGDSGVVMLTAREIQVLDRRGRPVRRVPLDGGAMPSGRVPRAGGSAADDDLTPFAGMASDGDWSDSYDPDDPDLADSEVLVTDGGGARGRRARRTATARGTEARRDPVAFAVGGAVAWLGRGDGLWRLDLPDGVLAHVRPATDDGIRAVATNPDGSVVAVIDGGRLLRSEDGGATFIPAGVVTGTTAALAVTGTGVVVVADGTGLGLLRPGADRVERMGDLDGASDVAACGDATLVLARGAVVPLSDAAVAAAPIQAPEGTRGLACAAEGSAWVAYGARLWISRDRGDSWSARPELPAGAIAGVAGAGGTLWVASSTGLWPVSTVAPLPTVVRAAPDARRDLVVDHERAVPSWKWWYDGLPRVDLAFAVGRSPARRDVRATLLLTFLLDRSRAAASRGNALATEVARRRQAIRATDAAWLARSTAADSSSDPDRDPFGAEERAALIRALEDYP